MTLHLSRGFINIIWDFIRTNKFFWRFGMPDTATLILFLTTSALLVVVPGPSVLYIVARSIERGRLAGIVSVLGIGAATLVHIAAAALGLSALLLSSSAAFNAVKYLGAAYLIYLGVRTLLSREELRSIEGRKESASYLRVFGQGFLVNLFNPKTALFFFAFLPQFVDASRGNVTWQILFLGVIFVFLGAFNDSIYALLAGSISKRLKGSLRFLRAQRYFSGTVYIGLGVATAVSGSNKIK